MYSLQVSPVLRQVSVKSATRTKGELTVENQPQNKSLKVSVTHSSFELGVDLHYGTNPLLKTDASKNFTGEQKVFTRELYKLKT